MSQATAAADHGTHQTSMGLHNRKFGMWLFIASECMFFGTLIAAYMVYKGRSLVGPYPQELLDIPLTTISTFILLMSSLSMVLAVAAIQRGDQKGTRLWLFGVAFLGLIFLGFQAYEFNHFVHEGLTLSGSLFGTTFYVLTGFHGAHVAGGVIWMLALLVASFRGKLTQAKSMDVEIAGLYWHFVDVVWIIIFTVVYLLDAA